MTLVIGFHGLMAIFSAGWLLGMATAVGLMVWAWRKKK